MKFGLTDPQFKYLLATVVTPLEEVGAKVWCYGSRARDNHSEFSDVDLMVEANHNHSVLISQIRETLEKGNFPFKVDLVSYSEFAESYKENYQKEKQAF